MTRHIENFDSYAPRMRLYCSGGHRMFNIMPDGNVTRCVAFYYVNKPPIGNIADDCFFESIARTKDKTNYGACERGYCIDVCDACYSEQGIVSKNGLLDHVGHEVERVIGKDYCFLQVHLTALCNFTCDYCCAADWMEKLKKGVVPVEVWKRAAERFTSTFETGFATIMGGEPIVSPAFTPFCGELLRNGWGIQVVTNFSLPRKFEELCETLSTVERERLRIQVSLHVAQPRFNLDQVIGGLIDLQTRYKVTFAATLVETKENMEICRRDKIEEQMKKIGALWFTYLPNRP